MKFLIKGWVDWVAKFRLAHLECTKEIEWPVQDEWQMPCRVNLYVNELNITVPFRTVGRLCAPRNQTRNHGARFACYVTYKPTSDMEK